MTLVTPLNKRIDVSLKVDETITPILKLVIQQIKNGFAATIDNKRVYVLFLLLN